MTQFDLFTPAWDDKELRRNSVGGGLLTTVERAGKEDQAVLRQRAFARWKRLEHALVAERDRRP